MMDHQKGMANNKPPLFTGENYAYWSVRMKAHLMSFGWRTWEATQEVYNIGDQAPTDPKELSEYDGNSKALNAILNGLADTIFPKFMSCKTAKEASDELEIIYEGESKVKESKL